MRTIACPLPCPLPCPGARSAGLLLLLALGGGALAAPPLQAQRRGPLAPSGMPTAAYRTPDDMEAAARSAWSRGEQAMARRMVATAQAYRQLGRPYLYGGTGRQRDGRIDCSALVQWAYGRAGVRIPRTSREQVRWGLLLPRETTALVVGDLLFFGVGRVSHVGIYLGGGYFVHASSTIGRVAISSLSERQWAGLWLAARRVPLHESPDVTTPPTASGTRSVRLGASPPG